MKASSGQIWRAKRDCIGDPGDKKRRVVVNKGELVEFRYWSAAHVRTVDDLYLEFAEDEFYYNFEFVGNILDEVNRRNQNSTKEILDAKLYTLV